MKLKFGDMYDKTSKVRIRRMRKEVVVCVQDVVGNNNLLFQFEDGKKRDMSTSSMSCACSKEEVGQEVDDTIYEIPYPKVGGRGSFGLV